MKAQYTKTQASDLWLGTDSVGRNIQVAKRAIDGVYFFRAMERTQYGLQWTAWSEKAVNHPSKIRNPMYSDYDVPEYIELEDPTSVIDWGFKTLDRAETLERTKSGAVKGIRLPASHL